ncbi:MAG: CRISPR-associated helicase Cas3' [Pelolinea sp.]|nr:CRISPR-associated helicase Cas3' [Pelolinea sp.]
MGITKQQIFAKIWAKYNQENNTIHPLICHLIDSGNVCGAIWDFALTNPVKNRFSELLGMNTCNTKNTLQLIIALHDIGKASIAFQSCVPKLYDDLKQLGFSFPKRSYYSPQPHDLLSAWCLKEVFAATELFNDSDADLIASVLGGHHGFFYSAHDLNSSHRQANLGDSQWVKIRADLFDALFQLFSPPKHISLSGDIEEKQAALLILSGMVVTADWLASDEKLFPYFSQENFSLNDYFPISEGRAASALEQTGWNSWKPGEGVVSFSDMFHPYIPNTLQEEVIKLEEEIEHPFLAIIEVPTGQGKTEAALYLTDRKIQKYSLRGMYVAMPTMATSNQMFKRVASFLESRYPQDLINLQLAHSQAKWNVLVRTIKVEAVGQDINNEDQHVVAFSWFLPKKKTLLAPFGVGTVDQSLISVLKTKHFFLRLFGLSHKVIIFDEVHAYDTYMSTLFLRLLEWLKLLGCSVIILSATLPISIKKKITNVFSEFQIKDDQYGLYPSLTIADDKKVHIKKIPDVTKQHYQLNYIGSNAKDIVDLLSEELSAGGCAAVIVNTVNRAQQVFQAIKDANLIDDQEEEEALILFHARFPGIWRQSIESRVLEFFKKDGTRPKKAIIVATQVIEQSLDLDFDVMITDLAPVDLIIQRAGRLHRHTGQRRPQGLSNARLHICMPEEGEELDFGKSIYIYEKEILLATYLILRDKNDLILPDETRAVIEQVYDPRLRTNFPQNQQMMLEQLSIESQAKMDREELIAYDKLIPQPGDERILQMGRMDLEEDSPEMHQAFQALTRLMIPSISIVCLCQENERLLTIDRMHEVSLEKQSPLDVVELLVRSTVNVSNRDVINHFRDNVVLPTAWEKIAALRSCYYAVFIDGIYIMDEKHSLVLDKETGLNYVEEK